MKKEKKNLLLEMKMCLKLLMTKVNIKIETINDIKDILH